MSFGSAGIAHLTAREAVSPRVLFWVKARTIGTLTSAPFGFWNGADDLEFTINGSSRVYLGGIGKFDIEPIVYAKGLDVRTQRITLSANSTEVLDRFRGYVIGGAAVEVHLALMDPFSGTLIDMDRRFKGFLNRAPETQAALDSGGRSISAELVSSLRLLTRTENWRKNNAHQRLRSDDAGRKYSDATDDDVWRKG